MIRESLQVKKTRAKKILKLLQKNYPEAKCTLHFKNPLELLIATQLSAQCTDKRVNQVTKALFKKYKTARAYAKASLSDLEKLIFSTGFYKNKAKNIKKSCEKIHKFHKGKVPNILEELISLNGVGRKTAHVVMGTAFQIPSGIVVDTHVKRLSYRMNFVNHLNVLKIETDLGKIIENKEWISFSHYLIEQGRKICLARKPRCGICFLSSLCPRKGL